MGDYLKRLSVVTDSQENLKRVYDRALSIANDTGASLKNTINLYAWMTRATEDLNLSEDTRFQITAAINQAMAISGTTTAEAAAVIPHLSQGLASGVLRGEALNAVIDLSPRLAKAIAGGVCIKYGELRTFAAEGKLTSEVVIRAIANMSGEIASEFAEMPVTINRTSTLLSNSIADAFNQRNLK